MMINRAQLEIRRGSRRIGAGEIHAPDEVADACEFMYELADLCHSVAGAFSYASKKERRSQLHRRIAYGWKVSPPERRQWLLRFFEEMNFDYRELEDIA